MDRKVTEMTYSLDGRNGSAARTGVPMRPIPGRSFIVADRTEAPRHPVAAPPVESARPASPTDLTKVSIYLDERTDAFLETVRTAARFGKPRVDATRSAVVRLALNRLAEQLHPAELVAELHRKAATHVGPGRKRA